MKKFFVIICTALLLAGCKAGSPSLFITPNPVTVKVGGTATFSYGVNNDFEESIDLSKLHKTLVDPDDCVTVAGTQITGVKKGEAELVISYDKPALEARAKVYVVE